MIVTEIISFSNNEWAIIIILVYQHVDMNIWTRKQWGTYLVDALTKNRDISLLPHSSIPLLPIHTFALHDLLHPGNG